MNKVNLLRSYISSLDGYKISNTHFKIGAKVHSSDFFYAKRLFQNSYYTARIALRIAMDIKKAIEENTFFLDENHTCAITLIGYETYSELLLSLIQKFLIDSGYININHFVVIDIDDQKRISPDNITINENAIIIVPIASTGSTAIKIEEFIKSKFNTSIYFPLTHTNIILASDNSPKFKEITNQTSDQYSLIKLSANWQDPADCTWCFDAEKSRPLFETDKSSLTPALIFNFPKAKAVSGNTPSVPFDSVVFQNALIYLKAKRNDEHYLYSTNTNIFIKNNKEKITKWLDALQDSSVNENGSEVLTSNQYRIRVSSIDKIILLSPCHFSNTTFINLVNEKLFHSAATIIHHQIDIDYLPNFKLLNNRFLNQPDAKVFFVDDSLISGKTFFRIYDLFRFATDYNKELSGAIFLSNKSSPDINERVSRACRKNLFAFVNVNLPSTPKVFGKNPLEHEIKRYNDIHNKALHDFFRKQYLDKAIQLDNNASNEETEDDKARHLLLYIATHKLYEFYETDKENVIKRITDYSSNNQEVKIAFLKVLSQYPFLLYEPVKKMTYNWHKEWLKSKIESLQNILNQEVSSFTYNDFKELKVLIRRSIFLDNYEILSERFFILISSIFETINKSTTSGDIFKVPILTIENQEGKIKDNLRDFHLFLLHQYIELINKNGWCAVKLSENIRKHQKVFVQPSGRQFFRMLQVEIAVVLNDFYGLLNDRMDWRTLYKYEMNSGLIKEVTTIVLDEDNQRIINFFEDNQELLKYNKFEICNKALNLMPQNKLSDEFLNFLWVKQFLSIDKISKASNITLTDKTEATFSKLKGVFKEKTTIGSFFIITDGNDIPHLVYNKDSDNKRLLKQFDPGKYSIILNFLKGELDNYNIAEKTIIEYFNTGKNHWQDKYSLNKKVNSLKFIEDYKWVMFIRLSDKSFKTLGLIGFVSKKEIKDDLLARQLLMLLRNDLGLFIKKHHKNDEFNALREAEIKKRYAYLAGHGRSMIQKLAREHRDPFEAIVDTMEKLQYLFATKFLSNYGDTKSTKLNSNQKLLSNIFEVDNFNQQIINNLGKLADEIYETPIIENRVKIEKCVPKFIADTSEFNFSSDLFNFICFELFVNAKKNRYHFIDNCPRCGTSNNSLFLEININKSVLSLKITGTGTSIPENVKAEINGGIADVKPEYEIAGLSLIYRLIKAIDRRNKISIRSDLYMECCHVYLNTLEITLNTVEKDA